MKTLPDNPNLDHLRRQAKELLAGLRDSSPSVSLAAAQTALARQYGFRDWPELKAEVDRRRGSAATAAPALAHELAERYGLGRVTGEMRSLARADEMGRQWSLETDRGRWAVRTMDTWHPIVDADTDVDLQLAAATAGVLLPTPVRSRSGAVVESIGGHSWRVREWRHPGPPLVAPASAAVTRSVGTVLATVHGLALPVDRVSPWHAFRFTDTTWPELAAIARARQASWADELTAAVPTLVELSTIGQDAPTPEPVLSHNSLGPGNARLGTDGRLIVVGWEHAGGQPPGWELGEALMNWAVDPSGGVNVAGARAMVEGYGEAAGSLPLLDPGIFRGGVTAVCNYVFGQLHLAMDARDPEDRRHADRNVRHLLSHLPTRTALERLLDVAVLSG
ncbi:glyoxalase superfamily protein [Nonomuraea sp. H19]|uniref:glyoxalase superfamily protein n=1 Tax=Nonomuraea sp. H19 TaxID=3452206 RepID=UPI003F8B60DE